MPSGSAGRTRFEYSAGGIVQDGDNLLMVEVENLEGHHVWTFPKGHIEKGESAEEAALREVQEETGYRCTIVAPLERVQYWFKREDTLTKKTVTWFMMKALEKTGTHDTKEIIGTRWVPLKEALLLARYKSDKKILAKLSEGI
jgi:8-oxo-dGTP pyrophosphatase MutT (NUDIX family)